MNLNVRPHISGDSLPANKFINNTGNAASVQLSFIVVVKVYKLQKI